MSAPPGWYPTDDGRQRWWDGQAWTEHVSGPVLPPPTAAYPQPYGQQPYGQQPYGQQMPYAGPVSVSAKSPALCLLISFFVPGIGSMVGGRAGTGVVILGGWLLSVPLVFLFGLGVLTGFLFWVWGLFDAYYAAQGWNRRHGILS